jgi:hypothetical protein
MLLHQIIVVVVATAKRFESVLSAVPSAVRRLLLRIGDRGSDLQET